MSNYLVEEAKKLGVMDLCRVYSDCIAYKGYVIRYDPPPIPDRRFDWQFQHEQFDGAPDGGDRRHGEAASLSAALNEIDELVNDELEMQGPPDVRAMLRVSRFPDGRTEPSE